MNETYIRNRSEFSNEKNTKNILIMGWFNYLKFDGIKIKLGNKNTPQKIYID